MHHHKSYMYVNFQQNRVNRSVKTVHTNLFAKKYKLHKYTICNYNFEKSRVSDICTTPYQTFRPILGSIGILDIKLPQKDIDTDGRTDGRTDTDHR